MIQQSNITRILAAMLGVAVIAAGCTKEIAAGDGSSEPKSVIKFGATMPEAETRTSLGEKSGNTWSVVWNEGDKIIVNNTPSEALAAEGAGSTTAIFSVELTADSLYQAIYPASINVEETYTLPDVQSYKAGQFSPGSAVMVGKSTTNSIQFTHVCGYIRVKLQRKNSETLSRVSLSSGDKSSICGPFSVTDYTLGTISMNAAGRDCISMNAENGLQYDSEGKADLVFAIPAREYLKGLVLAVENTDGTEMIARIKSAGFTLGKGVMYTMDSKTFEEMSCPFSGNGTSESPYLISSATDLRSLSLLTNYGNTALYNGKYYRQSADIDMNGINGYMPIAQNGDAPFTGTYDGNGKKISNLNITSTFSYTGLFGACGDNAVIENVTLESPTIYGSRYYIAAVVGYIGTTPGNTAICRGCKVSGATINAIGSERNSVGGIVGKIMSGEDVEGKCSCTIDSCEFSGTITPGSNKYVGCVAGLAEFNSTQNEFTVQNCKVSKATISGTADNSSTNSGLVGFLLYHSPASVTISGNKVSELTIEANDNYMAGCVGLIKMTAASSTCTAKNNSVDKASLTGYCTGHVGGFTGCAYMCNISDYITIDGFTFNGNITASKHMVGGVVGDNDFADNPSGIGNLAISNCMISGNIKGAYYVGGAIGLAQLTKLTGSISIVNCGYTGGEIETTNSGTYTGLGGMVGYCYITKANAMDIYNCYSLPDAMKTISVEAKVHGLGGIMGSYKSAASINLYNCYSNLTLDKVYVAGDHITTKETRMGGIYGLMAPAKSANAHINYLFWDATMTAGANATSNPVTKNSEAYDYSGSKASLVTKLNAAVDAYTDGTFKLKKWELGANGYPTFKEEN